MISVGQTAKTDPLMAYATVMASELLRRAAEQPASRRRRWLRAELNKTNPGIGTDAIRKLDSLVARGVPPNQAALDALRLTIANHIASAIDTHYGSAINAKNRAMSGLGALGSSREDINAVFCGIMGTATVGGSIYTSASSNPTGSQAVGESGAAAMTAAGCGSGALEAQARIAEANARAAEAAVAGARGASVAVSGDMTTYVIIGGVALVTLVGGVLLLRRK